MRTRSSFFKQEITRALRRCAPALMFLAMFTGPLPACAQAPNVIANFTGRAFGGEAILYDPGVFSVQQGNATIASLCLPSNGVWEMPAGSGTALCAVDSDNRLVPPDVAATYAPFAAGQPYVHVLNLGVDNQRYALGKSLLGVAEDANSADANLRAVAEAYGAQAIGNAFKWSFRSGQLPTTLRSNIPGGGIATQIGFAPPEPVFLFDQSFSALQTSLVIDLTGFWKTSTQASSQLTYVMNFNTLDEAGRETFLMLIVSLFDPNAVPVQYVGTDGRNLFASTPLAPSSLITQTGSFGTQTQAWNSPQTFTFQFTQANATALIQQLNSARAAQNLPLLTTDLSKLKFMGSSLRNENRFLYTGNVDIQATLFNFLVEQL